jgi:hypothetical protein
MPTLGEVDPVLIIGPATAGTRRNTRHLARADHVMRGRCTEDADGSTHRL